MGSILEDWSTSLYLLAEACRAQRMIKLFYNIPHTKFRQPVLSIKTKRAANRHNPGNSWVFAKLVCSPKRRNQNDVLFFTNMRWLRGSFCKKTAGAVFRIIRLMRGFSQWFYLSAPCGVFRSKAPRISQPYLPLRLNLRKAVKQPAAKTWQQNSK